MNLIHVFFLLIALVLCLLILICYIFDGKYRYLHILYYLLFFVSKTDTNTLREKYPDVIVSLTTSPARISKMELVIQKIMEQTIAPSKIVLNLPHIFKRDGSTYDEIPDFIKSNPTIEINRCEDIGPATKIIPTALLYSDPETIMISIDDDTIYKNDMIERLLNYSDKYPEAVISGSVDEYNEIVYNEDDKEYIFYGEYILGCTGVLYKSKFLLNFDQEKLLNAPKACYLSDDLYISNYLKQENIPIIAIAPYPDTYQYQTLYGFSYDALNFGANNDTGNYWENMKQVYISANYRNYEECSKYLKNDNSLFMTRSYKID